MNAIKTGAIVAGLLVCLLVGGILVTAGKSTRFAGVPLKRTFAKWDDPIDGPQSGLGASVIDVLDPVAVTLISEGGSDVVFPDRYREEASDYEVIKADKNGRFTGSWLSGEVIGAGLFPPAFDKEGLPVENRYGELFDRNGNPFPSGEKVALLESLRASEVEVDEAGRLELYNSPDRYPVPEVVVLARISQFEGDGVFVSPEYECYNRDIGFLSPSAHVRKKGDFLVSQAEFFTWHPASLSCSWTFKREGDIRALEMAFLVGEVASFGPLQVKALHRGSGVFDAGAGAVGKVEPVYRFSKVSEGGGDTCFFAINLPARMFRFVEVSDDGENWKRVEAGLDRGLGWFRIPSQTEPFQWRILYYPPGITVYADIEKLGGAPEYNQEATHLGEVRFPLGKMKMEKHFAKFVMWQLPGSITEYNSISARRSNPDFEWSEPDRLYSAGELFELWRKFSPDQDIRFDPETVTFSINDPESFIDRLKRRLGL